MRSASLASYSNVGVHPVMTKPKESEKSIQMVMQSTILQGPLAVDELIDLIDELSGLEIDVTDPELKFVQRPLISWGLL